MGGGLADQGILYVLENPDSGFPSSESRMIFLVGAKNSRKSPRVQGGSDFFLGVVLFLRGWWVD